MPLISFGASLGRLRSSAGSALQWTETANTFPRLAGGVLSMLSRDTLLTSARHGPGQHAQTSFVLEWTWQTQTLRRDEMSPTLLPLPPCDSLKRVPRHLVWHELCKCSCCTTAGFAGCCRLLMTMQWQCFRILTRSHESDHWRMLNFPSYYEFDWISSQTRVCTAKCTHIGAWLLWGLFDLIIILTMLPIPSCVPAISYYFFMFRNYPHWSGYISVTERNTKKSEHLYFSSELFM